MFRRKKNFTNPVELTLSLFQNKWKLAILSELVPGTRRFGELLHNIKGISQKVLTQALRALEKDGLIKRKVFPTIPPKVEYSRTEIACDLHKILILIADWGLKYGKLSGNEINIPPPEWFMEEKKIHNL